MSKYTTEVRYICEVNAGLTESVGFNDVNNVIADSRAKIFNFDYPIFDEAYKEGLETKILRHYYTREIGCETVGLWKLRLQSKLCEIMPYYNQLYESARLEFNPFYDVDYTKTHTGTNDVTKTGLNTDITDMTKTNNLRNETHETRVEELTQTTDLTRTDNLTSAKTGSDDSDRTERYSDTPQGGLTGITNNTYLTNVTLNNDTTTYNSQVTDSGTVVNSGTIVNDSTNQTDGTQTFEGAVSNTGSVEHELNEKENGTDTYEDIVKGKIGGADYSTLLKKYRETFLNIDVMVINELEDLFFQLW